MATQFATRFTPVKTIITNETGDTKTDQSKGDLTNIYALINKYGVEALIDKGKPEHELFIDTTIIPRKMTLAEANNLKKQFDEYFKNAPAIFRKTFKDNPDEFYNAYRQGEYDTLIRSGALTNEQINLQKEALKKERINIFKELDDEINGKQLNLSNNNIEQTTKSNKSD